MYDYLIVGAGITGATAAKMLDYAGKRAIVIERRDHLAGNCYDEVYPAAPEKIYPASPEKTIGGIRVNRYGGHIFHTNDERIWRFVRMFARFRHYEHRVKAFRSGRYYSFPPNRMTAQQLGYSPNGNGVNMELMYQELFYREFSEKAWGRKWEDLPDGIRKRVPGRDNWDDRYYTDRYQGLPEEGYTELVKTMLNGIRVELSADFGKDYEHWRRKAKKVIYTGALDELMDYELGKLEYRSLKFETKRLEIPDFQGCPTVNYPAKDVPYTVINEWKHYGWQGRQVQDYTVITYQTPASFEEGSQSEHGERYYPYIDDENRERHAQYVLRANTDGIIPAGRLGMFRYYNMDQAIGAAMLLVEKELQ